MRAVLSRRSEAAIGSARRRVSRFAADEQGSFVVFTLFLMMTVFLVAGVAVDAVRFESQRTRLQNTLDRAILAAADMSQSMDAETVVEGYFEKAGLTDYLASVTQTSTFNSKTVSATGFGDMETYFMKMVGIYQLSPAAAGTAEESISDIEISLVLDISNSMNEYIYETVTVATRYGSRTYRNNTGETKIDALKDAAKEFVDTIYASTATGRTSMSVIPYNSQVNVGPQLLSKYSVTNQHTLNSCVDFAGSDFDTTAISTTQTLTRSDHLDVWYRTAPPQLTVCQTNADNAILPLGDTAQELKDYIDDLDADGNTSIEIGMKWGAALLDPSAQPAVSSLIADTRIDASFEGRPFSFNNPDTMKVIVVMTDGHNTDQYILNSSYKTQLSGVWLYSVTGTDKYSVYYPEGNNTDRDGDNVKNESYWLMNECLKLNCSTSSSASLNPNKYKNTPDGGAQAQQLTYQQLWARMSIDYHAYNLRYAVRNSSTDYYAWDNEPYTSIGPTTKDARLDDICDIAKDNGIFVFAIGFEVTDEDAGKLKGCATSESHFYRVNNREITTAFQSIANAIGKLRLTQ